MPRGAWSTSTPTCGRDDPGSFSATVGELRAALSEDHPHRDVFDSAREPRDLYEKHALHLETGNEYAQGWDLVTAAALIARAPGPPLPDR